MWIGVITLFPEMFQPSRAGGAIAVGPGGAFEARAPTVPIRSKVGAGDSMVGGLVHDRGRPELGAPQPDGDLTADHLYVRLGEVQ